VLSSSVSRLEKSIDSDAGIFYFHIPAELGYFRGSGKLLLLAAAIFVKRWRVQTAKQKVLKRIQGCVDDACVDVAADILHRVVMMISLHNT
jgi:hypothetical protein